MLGHEMRRSTIIGQLAVDPGRAARPATTVAPSSSGARQASDRDKAATLADRHQELKAFAIKLPARQPNPVIVLRLPSGRGVNVSLRGNLNTVAHIQKNVLERSIKSNRVFLLVPGGDEPLPQNQDLRKLLPDIRELQVVVQSALPAPEEVD